MNRDNRFIIGRPDITNSIAEIKEFYKNSTQVVGWYAHPSEVRGPFCRWFTVSDVSPEYEKHVAYKGDDAKYAAAAMNNVIHLIDKIESLFDAIKHGDEKHQTWLKETIKTHFQMAEGTNK